MGGNQRRSAIIKRIKTSEVPVSGSSLAKEMQVSRQVIVQDIALLRAENKNILSTNKGYLLHEPSIEKPELRRTFHVKHTNAQIQDELYTIVDWGGKLLDVVVEHEIYGQITADLIIESRQDVNDFVEALNKNNTNPLNIVTGGAHYHTVEAKNQTILDRIEEALLKKRYLIK